MPLFIGLPISLHLRRYRRFFRRCRGWLFFRRQFLPVASFFYAREYCPDLRLLLHYERCSTLWAWLRYWHVRRRKIAIGIPRTAVEHPEPPAPALPHAASLYEFPFIAFRALDPHRDRPRVLALRISRTPDELPKTPVLLQEPISIQRTLLVQRLIRLVRYPRPSHQPPRCFAVGVSCAREKRSKSPALQRHFLPAVLAILRFVLRVLRNFLFHILDEVAFRIPRASQEEPVPANPLEQLSLPALLALFPCRNPRFVRHHLIAGLVQVHDELFPELPHRFPPRHLAFFDFVQLLFKPRGELYVEHVLETLDQQSTHPLTEHRRREPPLFLFHVLAFHNRRNYRRVRRRPANSVLFQFLHQRRFRIPRRRFREVLFRPNRFAVQHLSFCHPR